MKSRRVATFAEEGKWTSGADSTLLVGNWQAWVDGDGHWKVRGPDPDNEAHYADGDIELTEAESIEAGSSEARRKIRAQRAKKAARTYIQSMRQPSKAIHHATKKSPAQLDREIAEALSREKTPRGTDIDTTSTIDRKFRSRQRDALTLSEKARQARGAAARWIKRSGAYARGGEFRAADDAQTEADALWQMAADLEAEVAGLRTRSHATRKSTPKSSKLSDIEPGLRNVARRLVGAETRFLDYAMEHGRLSRDQAEAALAALRNARVIKFDAVNGTFHVTHGQFLEPDVLRRAAGVEE